MGEERGIGGGRETIQLVAAWTMAKEMWCSQSRE